MYFASDNAAGIAAPILEAISRANAGYALGYGNDDCTKRVEKKLAEIFEREVAVFLVPTGTVANSLALAHMTPPWGAVLCHREAHIEWHGVTLKRPDWSDNSHSLAFSLKSRGARFVLHVMLNAYWEPLTFELPPVPAESPQAWRRCIDTALKSPDDICTWEAAPLVRQTTYVVQSRSLVLLALALQGTAEAIPQLE